MSLASKLESIPQREVSGSDAYAAFEFQLLFGLELLFEKFDVLNDYAVLFEFHDDVVLLTGTSSPTKIDFFQLKHTTKGNWTLAKLKSTPKKKSQKNQSILHKLYRNVQEFSGHTNDAQVVSNTYCSEFGQVNIARFESLSDEKKKMIVDHIKSEFPEAGDDCLKILGFRRTELDKKSCHELVKGRVHSFLREKLGGDAFQLEACTNAIVTQCRLRNKKLATDVSGILGDIVAEKGITKSDLDDWLVEIALDRNAPAWHDIAPYLGDDWSFSHKNSVRIAYESYKVEALDSANDAQNTIIRIIREELSSVEPSEPISKFVDNLIGLNNMSTKAMELGYSNIQLSAMVIYEIFKSQQAGKI